MRSQWLIVASLALDAALFGVNLSVGLLSGSRAVLSQAVYIIADFIGGVLLIWGYVASSRPPDDCHPFGRGKERFFWAFSASLVTFTVAGILVLIDAVQGILHPGPVTFVPYALLVLAATVVASMVGIWLTLRELRREQATLTSFLESSHMGVKTIFYQDVVSVFGAFVALVGILLVVYTGRPVFDGVAALGVGLLLLGTGILLAAECRELLVGKAMSQEEARRILQLVERDPRVRRVRELQSMMLGPEDVLLALRVNFQDGLTTDQIESAIDQLSIALRETFPMMRHLLIEPGA
ncbi:MAG: cation diffusion facilitator family transporter [Thermoplasmata archaeon]|nr:cation diffusion facilitator family transporter [Thermoplasmata archaeon]